MNQDLKFYVWHTGGGCTAWRLDIPDTKLYVLVTQDLSHEIDYDLPVEVGMYRNEDNEDVTSVYFGEFLLK